MKAIILPIDNRPITYLFPQLVCAIAGVDAVMPPRSVMGSLTTGAAPDAILDWLNATIQSAPADALIASIDALVYGGLITSRRTDTPLSDLLNRTKAIERWRRIGGKQLNIFAQSSIMRISDNYDNTEEKQYWSRFGRQIFAWSEAMHRLRCQPVGAPTSNEVAVLEAKIDEPVRRDYLATRWRNHQINRRLVDYVKLGLIDYLVFSQDDSGQYGLNVLEKELLLAESQAKGARNVAAYAGADEVLLTLLSRWFVTMTQKAPRVVLHFSPENGASIMSRYEGQALGESVANQMRAAGLVVCEPGEPTDAADFTVIVHTSGSRQGDHIHLSGEPDLTSLPSEDAVKKTMQLLEQAAGGVVLCDVAYANGADPLLVAALLERRDLMAKLWGYAGWNTSGNTIGSALSMGTAWWYAQQERSKAATDQFRKAAMFVRFSDDWAYQTQVRRQLQSPDQEEVSRLMKPHLERIAAALEYTPGPVRMGLPWNRTFEIEVALPSLALATSVLA